MADEEKPIAAEGKEKKAKKKPSAPSRLFESNIIKELVPKYFKDRCGGIENIRPYMVRSRSGKEKLVGVFMFDKEKRNWHDIKVRGGKNSMMTDMYANYIEPAIAEKYPGYPLVHDEERLIGVVESTIMNRHSYEEHEFQFDALEPDPKDPAVRFRFRFGELGVCEARRDDEGNYKLITGLENKPEYNLIVDFEEPVASEEEYHAKKDEFFKQFNTYGYGYAAEKDYKCKKGGKSLSGNHFTDALCRAMIRGFVKTSMAKIEGIKSKGETGKGTLNRLMMMCMGKQMCTFLPNDTLCESKNGNTTDPRKLAQLKKMIGKRLGLIPDSPTKAIFESNTIKPVGSREPLEVGGMFQPSVTKIIYGGIIFSCNELPRINDSSRGTSRRLEILNQETNCINQAGPEMSNDDVIMMFEPLMPVFRRHLFEVIKQIVEVYRCEFPLLHESLKGRSDATIETTQWNLKTEMEKCFTQVDVRDEKDHPDYDFRDSSKAKYKLKLGSTVSSSYSGNARAVEENEKGTASKSTGLMLAAKIIHTINGTDERRIQQSGIKTLLENMSWKRSRNYFQGYRHTPHFVEMLYEYYGSAEAVRGVLRALYNGDDANDIPLTEKERKTLGVAVVAVNSDKPVPAEAPAAKQDDKPEGDKPQFGRATQAAIKRGEAFILTDNPTSVEQKKANDDALKGF